MSDWRDSRWQMEATTEKWVAELESLSVELARVVKERDDARESYLAISYQNSVNVLRYQRAEAMLAELRKQVGQMSSPLNFSEPEVISHFREGRGTLLQAVEVLEWVMRAFDDKDEGDECVDDMVEAVHV